MKRVFKGTKKTIKEKASYVTASGTLDFTLVRSSARRNLTVCIDERAEVTVSVPFYCTKKFIYAFLDEKAQWIQNKLTQAYKSRDFLEGRKFEHGKKFLFLGNHYPIEVCTSIIKRARIKFDNEKWLIFLPPGLSFEQKQEELKRKMLQWYRTQAQEVLGSRIFYYSRIMGVAPKKLAVRTQKRVWGNCDYNTQTIHLNWQIIMSPMDVIDYVVVHEMCHLTIPNHSDRFWSAVEKTLPDYKIQKKWLSEHYLEMVLA